MAVCFKVVIFHGLTRCVSFDYVINGELIKMFQLGTSMCPQTVYCSAVLIIKKYTQIFKKFFLLTSYNHF